jgi:hypothetical protein
MFKIEVFLPFFKILNKVYLNNRSLFNSLSIFPGNELVQDIEKHLKLLILIENRFEILGEKFRPILCESVLTKYF